MLTQHDIRRKKEKEASIKTHTSIILLVTLARYIDGSLSALAHNADYNFVSVKLDECVLDYPTNHLKFSAA